MRCSNPLLAAALVLLAALAASEAGAQDRSVAFVDVSLVPMDSARAVPGQTVVVRDGRIVALGPATATAVPEGAEVIDGRGRYLMPGLADMHVHLTHPEAGGYYHEDNGASFDLLLAHGVTTVRNMWGTPGLLALRDSVRAGLVLGPHVTTTGPFVEGRPGTLPGLWSVAELGDDPFIIRVRTEADGRAAAHHHADVGYDYVKVRDRIPAAAYRGLVDEAARLGLPVVGHAPRTVGLGAVLTRGHQGSIEHVAPFAGLAERSDSPARSAEQWYDRVWGTYAHNDPERVGLLAEIAAASRVWVTPTLFTSEWYSGPQPDMLARLQDPDVLRYTSAAQRDSWREYAEGFATSYARWGLDMEAERAFGLRMVQALDSTGARLLLGTDATPAMGIQGLSVHEELALMVEAGLTPFAALRTATVNAQTYLREVGRGSSSGIVRAGEPADLVLLDANPLDDITNARRVRGVVTRGQWLNRADLDGMLADAETRYREPAPEAAPDFGARTPRTNPDAPAVAYVGGLWYEIGDGDGRFVARDTTWAEGGVFVAARPANWQPEAGRVVDLGDRHVVPPFADAHVHRVEGEWAVGWVVKDHLEAGTFYVKNLNNIARYARQLAPHINRPGGIDVSFAHGGITAPGAHPLPLYARLAESVYRDLDSDSLDGVVAWGVATVEDLERRWPEILAERPNHIKLLLLDHESGQGLWPDVFRRAVGLAREAGLRTSVHVDTAADLALAVDAGADEAAHMPPMFGAGERSAISEALAARMAARGFVVTPTASVAQARDFEGKEDGQAQRAENVRRLLDAGVFVAMGTDGSATSAIGEAETLVEIGAMTPTEALYSLTQTGPRSVFPGRAIGRLAPGYEASFLALACDPAADLACARRIERRVKQGAPLPEPERASGLD